MTRSPVSRFTHWFPYGLPRYACSATRHAASGLRRTSTSYTHNCCRLPRCMLLSLLCNACIRACVAVHTFCFYALRVDPRNDYAAPSVLLPRIMVCTVLRSPGCGRGSHRAYLGCWLLHTLFHVDRCRCALIRALYAHLCLQFSLLASRDRSSLPRAQRLLPFCGCGRARLTRVFARTRITMPRDYLIPSRVTAFTYLARVLYPDVYATPPFTYLPLNLPNHLLDTPRFCRTLCSRLAFRYAPRTDAPPRGRYANIGLPAFTRGTDHGYWFEHRWRIFSLSCLRCRMRSLLPRRSRIFYARFAFIFDCGFAVTSLTRTAFMLRRIPRLAYVLVGVHLPGYVLPHTRLLAVTIVPHMLRVHWCRLQHAAVIVRGTYFLFVFVLFTLLVRHWFGFSGYTRGLLALARAFGFQRATDTVAAVVLLALRHAYSLPLRVFLCLCVLFVPTGSYTPYLATRHNVQLPTTIPLQPGTLPRHVPRATFLRLLLLHRASLLPHRPSSSTNR